MNPLSFRLRDVVNNSFEYHHVGCRQFLIGLDGVVYDGQGNRYEKYIVNQWCGLKTSFDDYIYDGDIVEFRIGSGYSTYGPYIASVGFYNHGWCFRQNQCMPEPIHQMEDIRVVGNIYDGLAQYED